MAPIQPKRRRNSGGFWLGGTLLFLILAGGTFALMFSMELGPWAVTQEDPYMVRIPINGQPIPAYAKVTREDLMAGGNLVFQKLPPESVIGMSISGVSSDQTPVSGKVDGVRNVDENVVFVVGDKEVPQARVNELGGAIMNISGIIGRVVRRDKRAGLGFQESNFFPRGTPEGIAGATPRGMKAITMDATRLTGIHALNSGNRLDLIASVPTGDLAAFKGESGSLPGAALVVDGGARKSNITEPILLAKNALLLRPVTVRNETSSTSSLTSGKRLVNEPKYEVTIAVLPEDLIPLQNALDRKLSITCVATSMQPETEGETPKVGSNQLMAPVTVRAVPAYAVLTREAFVNPATRTVNMKPVTQRQIDLLNVSTRLEDVLGSIARHDIPPGSFVRGADLLHAQEKTPPANADSDQDTAGLADGNTWQLTAQPVPQQNEQPGASVVGDRPSVTGFVPRGRTAIAVPWNRLYGGEHLQIDDRIDLIASFRLERNREVRSTSTGRDQNVVAREYEEIVSRGTDRSRDETLAERGEPWFIATDALVVGPVGFPASAPAMRAIGSIKRQSTDKADLSGPAILLAIDNRDLESIATALNTDGLLTVAFRPKPNQSIPDGFREIAVAPLDMEAYTEFSDQKWKGLRREMTGRLVLADAPQFKDAISMSEIDGFYGRVLRVRKSRFAAFRESDFMPPGTPPGAASAIASGSVLINVTADQIQSINRFRNDDVIALILTGNFEPGSSAVVHSSQNAGPEAQVIVQSARIVKSVTDASNTIALEVSQDDASQLTAALFAHDASDGGDRQNFRLMAVARNTTGRASQENPEVDSEISGHSPLSAAPRVFELIGGRSRTHYFPSVQGGQR